MRKTNTNHIQDPYQEKIDFLDILSGKRAERSKHLSHKTVPSVKGLGFQTALKSNDSIAGKSNIVDSCNLVDSFYAKF